MDEELLPGIGVECYAGYRGEQTPRTLILGDRRIGVVEVVDAWLAPGALLVAQLLSAANDVRLQP